MTVTDRQEALERMWRAIRAMRPGWTGFDVAQAADVRPEAVSEYVAWLAEHGYVRAHGPGKHATTALARQTLAAPSDADVERVTVTVILNRTKPGAALLAESRPGAWESVTAAVAAGLTSGGKPRRSYEPKGRPGKLLRKGAATNQRDVMWKRIRELKEFGQAELQEVTGYPPSTVADFLGVLYRAEVLKKERVGVAVRYRLERDPGPERPATPERESKRAKSRRAA